MTLHALSTVWNRARCGGEELLALEFIADNSGYEEFIDLDERTIASGSRRCRISQEDFQVIIATFREEGLIVPFSKKGPDRECRLVLSRLNTWVGTGRRYKTVLFSED